MTSLKYYDRVFQISTSTGTEKILLEKPVKGYRTFSDAIGTDVEFEYVIESVDKLGVPTGAFEIGVGKVVQESENYYLERIAVYKNSSGTTEKIDFEAGEKNVWCDVSAKTFNEYHDTLDTSVSVAQAAAQTATEKADEAKQSAAEAGAFAQSASDSADKSEQSAQSALDSATKASASETSASESAKAAAESATKAEQSATKAGESEQKVSEYADTFEQNIQQTIDEKFESKQGDIVDVVEQELQSTIDETLSAAKEEMQVLSEATQQQLDAFKAESADFVKQNTSPRLITPTITSTVFKNSYEDDEYYGNIWCWNDTNNNEKIFGVECERTQGSSDGGVLGFVKESTTRQGTVYLGTGNLKHRLCCNNDGTITWDGKSLIPVGHRFSKLYYGYAKWGTQTITFPTAFSAPPYVVVSKNGPEVSTVMPYTVTVTTTYFYWSWVYITTSPQVNPYGVTWMAWL